MNILLPVLGLLSAPAPSSPVTWTTSSTVAADGSVRVEIVAHMEEGWHLYATELPSDIGPLPTIFRFTPSKEYMAVGALQEPPPVEEYDQNFGVQVRYHSGEPRFTLTVKPAVKGEFTVEGEVEYMTCNGTTCLPPVAVPFKITVTQAKTK